MNGHALHPQAISAPVIPDVDKALQHAEEAVKLANVAQAAILQLKDSLEAQNKGVRLQERNNELQVKKQRARWFPWILLALASNLMLWISMLFSIFRADLFATRPGLYLAHSFLILVVPLFVIIIVLSSPWPKLLRTTRIMVREYQFSHSYKSWVNMLNALCCFVLVVAYLYGVGIPQYNRGKWETSVDYTSDISLPSVFFTLDSDFGPSSVVTCTWTNLNSPEDSQPEACFSETFVSNFYDLTWTFDASKVPKSVISVQFSFAVNFLTYPTDFGMPELHVDIWDSRLSNSDAFWCNYGQGVTLSVLSSNILYLNPQLIKDPMGLIKPSDPSCVPAYNKVFSQEYPFISYSPILYPDNPSSNDPDLQVHPEDCFKNPPCLFTETLQLSPSVQITPLVSTLTSVPGIDQLTIWLNAGAIVGGVQFFAWFFGLFSA